MNWKKVDKSKRVQKTGIYRAWKQQIADDCFNQCVYCSIPESMWGGIDHYHIDHFRPKSLFAHLEDVITNLYYACPVCNKFKSDDWQNEPDDLNLICYPDPSDHNYSDLFALDPATYLLSGNYVASKYLINRLYLNRPQLIYERREYLLKLKFEALIAETMQLIPLCNNGDELVNEAFLKIAHLSKFLLTRSNISPYKLQEIKKPK